MGKGSYESPPYFNFGYINNDFIDNLGDIERSKMINIMSSKACKIGSFLCCKVVLLYEEPLA